MQLLARAQLLLRVHLADRLEHHVPALEEERVEDLVLGGEVVVDEAIRHARLVGDVGDAAGVEALAREHPHGGVEDHAPLVGRPFARPWRGRLTPASLGRAHACLTGQRYTCGRRLASTGS